MEEGEESLRKGLSETITSKMKWSLLDEVSHVKIREKELFQEDRRMYIYLHVWAHSQNKKKISIDGSPWVMENVLDEYDILVRTRWTTDFVNYVKALIFIPSMGIKHWQSHWLTESMQISSCVLKLFPLTSIHS